MLASQLSSRTPDAIGNRIATRTSEEWPQGSLFSWARVSMRGDKERHAQIQDSGSILENAAQVRGQMSKNWVKMKITDKRRYDTEGETAGTQPRESHVNV